MAWYPGAERMELQPESDGQAAITPTQLILHSIAAPWTPERMYEYWRDSTSLESHFGLGFDGRFGQYVGTQTRADANMYANRRRDGTGAVSVETASNLDHTDPWTAAQLEALIELGVWMHRTHGIPIRVCPAWDAPGFGYHRMFPQWSDGGTACPGDARARQFHETVLPGIAARAAGQTTTPTTPVQEDDVTPEELLATKVPLATLPGGYVPTVAELLNGGKTADAQLADLPQRLLSTPLGEAYARDGYVPTLADALNGGAYASAAAEQALAEIRELRLRLDQAGAPSDAQLQAAAEAGARAALSLLADRLKEN